MVYDESVIEGLLLNALNEIMYPEAEFESIRIQQIKIGGEYVWEIYLKEKGRERVPLSKSGSGIKTIILVLLNLIVVPLQSQNIGKTIVYGFEEVPFANEIKDYITKENSLQMLDLEVQIEKLYKSIKNGMNDGETKKLHLFL